MAQHTAVVGLGFGDEGKGSVVDHLCATREVDYVVRFNGGCQAGHNVVLPDGTHHTFSQLGSGTLRHVPTILSRHMLVEPMGYMAEYSSLRDAGYLYGKRMRTVVDGDCLVTTPWHMAVNHVQEARRGDAAHGSCGLGIGATVQFAEETPWAALQVAHRVTGKEFEWRWLALREWARGLGVTDEYDYDVFVHAYYEFSESVVIATSEEIAGCIRDSTCVFEGAQGVLLDESHGFHPHTTWSRTTFDNVDHLVDEPADVARIGVLRTYHTRHGAGPFPGEDPLLRPYLPEPHNDDDGCQKAFRVGPFDAVLARYAVECCGRVDGIALTHLDTVGRVDLQRAVIGWEDHDGADLAPWPNPGIEPENREFSVTKFAKRAVPVLGLLEAGQGWPAFVEKELNVPVVLRSSGPTADDKESDLG